MGLRLAAVRHRSLWSELPEKYDCRVKNRIAVRLCAFAPLGSPLDRHIAPEVDGWTESRLSRAVGEHLSELFLRADPFPSTSTLLGYVGCDFSDRKSDCRRAQVLYRHTIRTSNVSLGNVE